jgi:hypothetical protein
MNTLQNAYVFNALAPQALAATTELLGSAIDLSQLGGLDTIVYYVSTNSITGDVTVAVKESATTGGTYTAITNATTTLVASNAGTTMISVKLGGARLGFQKISLTAATATSRQVSAIAIATNPAFGVNGSTEALRATNAGLLSRAVV